MIIPDYIQVALDAIEEEDSFALEAEHQLVEWLEKIESGCRLNSINASKSWSKSWSKSGSWSGSGSGSGPGSGSGSISWSSLSGSISRSRSRSRSKSGPWSNYS